MELAGDSGVVEAFLTNAVSVTASLLGVTRGLEIIRLFGWFLMPLHHVL